MARIYLDDVLAEATPNRPVAVDGGPALDAFAGLYADPVTGETTELEIEDGALVEGRTTLVRVAEDEFMEEVGATRYLFDVAGGEVLGFEVDDWQYTDQRYERVEPWSATPAQLRVFTGTYHSDDAETTYRISVEGGALTVWQRPDVTRTLEPLYPDAFEMNGRTVRFWRGAGGRVEALSLSLGRVYDMRFERVGG